MGVSLVAQNPGESPVIRALFGVHNRDMASRIRKNKLMHPVDHDHFRPVSAKSYSRPDYTEG